MTMNTTDHASQPTPPGAPRGEPSPEAAVRQTLPTSAPLHVILHPATGARRRSLTWIGWLGFLTCLAMLVSQWSARRDYYDRDRRYPRTLSLREINTAPIRWLLFPCAA